MGSCEDEGSLGLAGPLPPSVALPSHALSAPPQDLGIWNGDLLCVPLSSAPVEPTSTPAALCRGVWRAKRRGWYCFSASGASGHLYCEEQWR